MENVTPWIADLFVLSGAACILGVTGVAVVLAWKELKRGL